MYIVTPRYELKGKKLLKNLNLTLILITFYLEYHYNIQGWQCLNQYLKEWKENLYHLEGLSITLLLTSVIYHYHTLSNF